VTVLTATCNILSLTGLKSLGSLAGDTTQGSSDKLEALTATLQEGLSQVKDSNEAVASKLQQINDTNVALVNTLQQLMTMLNKSATL
jgi:hypothetical protein